MNINEIVTNAKSRRASDIHFTYGVPIKIRVDGVLENYDDKVLDDNDLIDIVKNFTDDLETLQMDIAETIAGTRCRINIYHQQKHISVALRLLNDKIPSLRELGLPPVVSTFSNYNRGIVIITGETGSGKSTTLAALINEINMTRKEHIITLEDPIEYVYKPDKCLINQREVGRDVESYEKGLEAILREDPDIILVGEMRSLATIEAALTAAETGHLVFATLHTNSAADTIDRIVDVFPTNRQAQIRMQVSMCLKAVCCQQLLPKANEPGRVVACEIMVVNSAIRNLIREGKTPQIANTIATSKDDGSITMNNYLKKLVDAGTITKETAISASNNPDEMIELLGGKPLSSTSNRTFIR